VSTDNGIRDRIKELVGEERELRAKLGRREITAEEEHTRLREVEAELDQCWDLLRQRDARREFGENPDDASVRGADVVENYRG
jgi:predicted nuclease with TOPRIM domain